MEFHATMSWPKTFSFPLLLSRDRLEDIYASYRAYKLRNQEYWNKKGSFKAFRNVDTSINLPYLANLASLTSALRTFQFPHNSPSACVLLTIYACVNPVGQSAIRSYLRQVPEAKGASRSTQEGHSNTEESQKRKGKACGRLMKSLKFWIYFENLDWNTVIKTTTTEGTFFFKTVSSPFQTENFLTEILRSENFYHDQLITNMSCKIIHLEDKNEESTRPEWEREKV